MEEQKQKIEKQRQGVKADDKSNFDEIPIVIQKYYRAYLSRKYIEDFRAQNDLFLGIKKKRLGKLLNQNE